MWRGADGGVFHKALTSNATAEWAKIGEGITGNLNAFTTGRGEIGVVSLGRNSDSLYLPWVRDGRRAPRWTTLGTAPLGELSAEVIDDVVVSA